MTLCKYEFEIKDFERGQCDDCPLSYPFYSEQYEEWNQMCSVGGKSSDCPLVERAVNDEYERLKERDTPYRPTPDTRYYGNGICKCGAVFLTKDTQFCGNCGQRIDWTEQEEDHEN